MDAALGKLLMLRFRSGIRQRLDYLKSWRGWLLSLIAIVLAAFFLRQASLVDAPFAGVLSAGSAPQIDRFLPLGMLATLLLTVALAPQPALHFSPTEINLLFGGPFNRRAIVCYKLSSYAFGALLSSMLIALLMPGLPHSPVTTFLGVFLSLTFIQLLTVALGLSAQVLTNRLAIGRWLIFVLTVFLLGSATYEFLAADSLPDALDRFQSSAPGSLLLAPFGVFLHIVQARSSSIDGIVSILLGFTINSGLVAIIVKLDRQAFELSADASLKLHNRRERARRKGLLWSAQTEVVRSRTLPQRFGGIGPIAGRQLLSALRSSSKALWMLFIVSSVAGLLWTNVREQISGWSLLGGVFFGAVFVLPKTLVFDFRSDLDTMDTFKSIPLPSWQIVCGQLAVPVLLASLIEAVFLLTMAAPKATLSTIVIAGIGANLVPFNALLFGLENLFFLLFPAPLVPVGRADFDFLGRTLIEFVIKSTLLIASGFLAVQAGLRAMAVTGQPWPIFVFAAFVTMLLAAMLVLSMLGLAFKRFDANR